ncbi:InlB B-repeat-containing protein [Treponema medium]|nr:InlB B-repeat-containing protein [Treponema medium]
MFTVNFNLNGGEGTPPADQPIESGKTVAKPADPTRSGHTFKHWSKNADGAAYNFDEPVTSSFTLHAVWEQNAPPPPTPQNFTVSFNLNGGEGTPPAAQTIESGNKVTKPASDPIYAGYTFKHWSKSQTGAAYNFDAPVTGDFTLYAVWEKIKIYTIQGTAHESPLKGKSVKDIPGIVTGIHYSENKADGFYMQDKDGDGNNVTSDGIYVYCGIAQFPAELKVKDAVTVTGTVTEHAFDATQLATTQIKVARKDDVSILSSGNQLPAPIEITADKLEKPVFIGDLNVLSPAEEAIDYYESLEGMRVKITNPKVVAAPYKGTHYIAPVSANGFTPRGGLMYNSYNSTGRVCVYPYACFANKADAHVANPEPTIGDSYNGDIVGVLGYSFSNYRIEITEALPELTAGHIAPESSNIAFDATKLNIVSYNLENFSKAKGKKGHSSKKTPDQRATAFADHFINQLKEPDIICLIEIQDDSADKDNDVVSAQQTLNLLINKITAIGGSTYKSVNIDPENNKDGGAPGANIRCCYLYRDDRIELVQDSDSDLTNSDCNTAAEIEADGSKLTQNPARIGVGDAAFDSCRKSLVAHFKFLDSVNGGKDFFVINNHLTSKRGDGSIWGAQQPVVRASEVNRHKQADAITAFIKSVKEKRSDARIISVGDYNDFWFSETIGKVKAAGMKNAIEEFSANERYTYVYDGHSQTLDNILVTDNIAINYADVLHLNAEFSPKVRLSDHDPVFVQLSW